ncbi:hypothetical protein Ate02nite_49600 [Paractinoplanes tereljensis]|uniref:Uncharacterized protein n=1 Tax=Paractinoplanes tereljensis TaxID=571912 RepID=A0A919NQ67_9ACTN|nr:hypothetical protein Ate02nite_49600 [Actinoplanes tereljensis]
MPAEQVRGRTGGIAAIVLLGFLVVEVAHDFQDGAGFVVLGVQAAGQCGDRRGVRREPFDERIEAAAICWCPFRQGLESPAAA